jgi:RND superfamily putative drug exporter
MLERLGKAVVRRARLVLVLTGIFFVAAGALGGGVASHLKTGGYNDPKSGSVQASDILDKQFGAGASNVLLLVRPATGSLDDPAVAAAGNALTRRLASEPNLSGVASYWSTGAPTLKSKNGTEALVIGHIDGADDAVMKQARAIASAYGGVHDGLDVSVGGSGVVFDAITTHITKDLAVSESVAIPLTALLLIVVFGSVVASLLPVGIGIVAIVGTLLALRIIAAVTDVSVFAMNLTTAMGLGLAIDYSLFILTRYRENIANGRSRDDAIVASVRTAGRTVVYSALVVTLSLAAMLVFPLYFLRSFAYAGVAVVILAAAAAVVVLPALLAVLGPRVDKWSIPFLARRQAKQGELWGRLALVVMRRPVVVAVAVLAFLLALGAPFLGVKFGSSDYRVLPAGTNARTVQQNVANDFDGSRNDAVLVVPTNGGLAPGSAPLADYAQRLSALANVTRVESAAGVYVHGARIAAGQPTAYAAPTGQTSYLVVVPAQKPLEPASQQLVRAVRALPAPAPVQVGGTSALLVDTKASIASALPYAVSIIVLATLLLLFAFTGSVLLPLKAVVLNALSLSATFGAMVWIFQEGHLSGLLHFTATGSLETTLPILMFCVAFGLSMDYEVFLLSRIKEEWDRTGDNQHAVVTGLRKTGRLISAAAALIAIVFASIAFSGVTTMKLFGVGLALAVVVDATIVRGLLVPAIMRLAGRWNWWAPAPLRRISAHWSLSDDSGDTVDVRTAPPAPVTTGVR